MKILFFLLLNIFMYADDSITNTSLDNSNSYQGFLLIYFIVMIVTIFMGYGESRKVVIFRDYDDVGLTFLIPVSFILISYLFSAFGGNPKLGIWLASSVAIILFAISIQNTYFDNNKSFLYTTLSIVTKVPLGVIWIVGLISILNPVGKTAAQKRKNRNLSIVLLTLLTPIIGMLVAEKQGSLLNPKDWIKSRRTSALRDYL